jgi:hypothetical protein
MVWTCNFEQWSYHKAFFVGNHERKKGTKRRPRRKQQIWTDVIQNGERTWDEFDKDLWAEKEVLLLGALQYLETSKREVGTSDQ